jgi:acyl carrier protein
MDEAGNLLRAGEIGEIVIQGANVTQGYENNPQANKAAFVDGWFRTGDLGLFDKDGYLRITGRIKEIINRGGEKVAPREVEEVLLRHPAVAQAVTFSVPHATLGEDIATAVVLVAGSSVTEQELREMALNQLANYKVPSQVVVVDEIPKGATGKLQRIGLADQLMGRLRVEYAAPSSQTEAAVAEIWAGVLGVRQVGVHDNFFRLGGDSLHATQAVSRMSAAFQIELPVTAMFREPTVAGQAVLIEEMLVEEIEALPEEEARRLTQ